MRITIVASAAALLAATAAPAQTYVQWTTPDYAQAAKHYFPVGTPLRLRTRTEVNSKQAKPGDRIYLEVAEGLSYQNQVVIPVGAPVVAEVVRAERNGHFGKHGVVEVRPLYMETPYGPVRISGDQINNGRDQALLSIGLMAVTGGWGWGLIHGTSAYLRHDTPVTAYLAEDMRFVQQMPGTQSAQVLPDSAHQLPAGYTPAPALARQ